MKKIKLLHLISRLDIGGAERQLAKLTRIPVIISSIHNQEWYLKCSFTRLLERFFALYIFDKIIAVSESVKRFAHEVGRLPKEKIKRVYYGINPLDIKINKNIREEFGIDKDVPLIGRIGRLVEQKGQKYLIEAVKKVIKEFPEAKFLIDCR